VSTLLRSVLRTLSTTCAVVLVLLFPGSGGALGLGSGAPPKPPFMAGEGKSGPQAAVSQAAATLPTGFTDTAIFSGLTNPTAVRFASDGRVFVAQKNGVLKVFDSLSDSSPTVVADLSTEVDDYWDRGLLGLALDPNFPTSPYVYLLYTYDAPPRQTAPVWNDGCPTPPGGTTDGCVVSGRLVRIQLSGDVMTGSPQVLLKDQWCQQFPSHSVGDLRFGPDGALYVSGGEGASFGYVDYGQSGGSLSGTPTPRNPCGDPPAGVGGAETAPTAEGGALRSQSLRRASGEPVLLNGAVLRLDPATGAAASGNPNSGASDPNAQRIVAYGLRNPFRFTFRPGTSELWIGDVGWNNWEEIDRVVSPTASPVSNFGWPCYEGTGVQSGYQAAGLSLCSTLYSAGTASSPYYTYAHGAAVVTNDGCPTANGSSITGDAFYTGDSYPAGYKGALVFADHTRNCIWAMMPGSNGLPDPTKRQLLVGAAANPVDIEAGPGGDIFYADLEGGSIHRITYSASDTCAANTFRAQYFNNMTLSGTAVIDRCEPAVNYNWGAGSPAPGVNIDGFSVSWDGSFDFAAGTYSFTAAADDGIRVFVDGAAVIDAWKDQNVTTYTASVPLTAGSHRVHVEYYEKTGNAVAQVAWQLPSSGGACPGQFDAQYFNNMTLSGTPVLERCEAAVNYDWGTASPAPGVNADGFSARWTGQFDFAAGNYTFTATADDGIRVYVDGALLIDKWIDQAVHTFTAAATLSAGTHTVKVEYYEHTGAAVAKVSWQPTSTNSAPAAVIDTPSSSLTYAVGDLVSFSGHASDTQDGTIPASGLSWTLIIHHCPTPSSCHTHVVQTWPGVASGSFNAPDHQYPSYLELQLTATDSGGLTNTASVQLNPKTVGLTFASSPSGLSLSVNGTSVTTPSVQTVVVNSANSLSAPSPQTLNGTTYAFSSWSDGGAASHNIVAPSTATTYTATFSAQAVAPPTNTGLPSISGPVRSGRTITSTTGTWTGAQPITYAYQWLRCDSNGNACAPISGATTSSYVIGSGDVGHRLRSQVTATNAGGSTAATSAATAVVKR